MQIPNEKCFWEILVPTVMDRTYFKKVLKRDKTLQVPIRDKNWKISTKYHKVWDKMVIKHTGGLTVYRPSQGYWTAPTGSTVRERMIPVRISCSRAEIREIAEFTAEYYNQEEVMYYLVSNEVYFYSEKQPND